MKSGNFLFVVQGEGRGHMTQAISLKHLLVSAGHKVSCVLIGKNPNREIPAFVSKQLNTEIITFESPNFAMDKKMKSIKIIPSVIQNLLKLGTFKRSLKVIDQKIKEHQPDVIINFYDPLIGLYYLLYNPAIHLVCIAHQYIYLHPGFEFPEGKKADQLAIRFYTKLTSIRATKKLALSFYPINNHYKKGIIAFPPLLRKEVFEQEIKSENYLLVYLVNSGYMEEIIKWHNKNPDILIHCFTDKKNISGDLKHDDTLYFHELDDKKFLKMMSECKGLISTAGFESVCEAMYLGKPVFMVPVEGHYEQFCNARDAFKANAGLYDNTFNISRFISYLPEHKKSGSEFKDWVKTGEDKFLEIVLPLIEQKN